MKKGLLIVNPQSGRNNGERDAMQIRGRLFDRGIECEIYLSSGVVAMDSYLENCPFNDLDFIGLFGGDGTMHTFLNSVLKKHDHIPVPVALFPCGTGNAFNFDIGCTTIDETLSAILSRKATWIDIAEVQYGDQRLWSFNILGCGLVADINKLAEDLRWLGSSRYTVASLIKLLANPRSSFKVVTDKAGFEGCYSFVLACNTRYTGKGMLMAPHARLNDGKFDVTLVKACSAFKLLRLFPKIFKGEHLGADVVIYLQTNAMSVSSGDLILPTNIDGEIKGQTPFSLTVRQNKVKVFMK